MKTLALNLIKKSKIRMKETIKTVRVLKVMKRAYQKREVLINTIKKGLKTAQVLELMKIAHNLTKRIFKRTKTLVSNLCLDQMIQTKALSWKRLIKRKL